MTSVKVFGGTDADFIALLQELSRQDQDLQDLLNTIQIQRPVRQLLPWPNPDSQFGDVYGMFQTYMLRAVTEAFSF